jgi:hypothetical protein
MVAPAHCHCAMGGVETLLEKIERADCIAMLLGEPQTTKSISADHGHKISSMYTPRISAVLSVIWKYIFRRKCTAGDEGSSWQTDQYQSPSFCFENNKSTTHASRRISGHENDSQNM